MGGSSRSMPMKCRSMNFHNGKRKCCVLGSLHAETKWHKECCLDDEKPTISARWNAANLQNNRERKLMITAYVCLIHIFPARRFRIVAFLIPPKVIIISIILQQQLLLLLLLLLFPASPTSSSRGLVLHMTALDHGRWAALLVPLIFVLRRNAEKLHVRFILVSDRRPNHHSFSSHLRSGKRRRSTSRRRCYRFIPRRLSLRRRSGCSRRNSRRRIIRRTLVTHLPSSLLLQGPLQKLLFLVDLAHRAPTPFPSSSSSPHFPSLQTNVCTRCYGCVAETPCSKC